MYIHINVCVTFGYHIVYQGMFWRMSQQQYKHVGTETRPRPENNNRWVKYLNTTTSNKQNKISIYKIYN